MEIPTNPVKYYTEPMMYSKHVQGLTVQYSIQQYNRCYIYIDQDSQTLGKDRHYPSYYWLRWANNIPFHIVTHKMYGLCVWVSEISRTPCKNKTKVLWPFGEMSRLKPHGEHCALLCLSWELRASQTPFAPFFKIDLKYWAASYTAFRNNSSNVFRHIKAILYKLSLYTVQRILLWCWWDYYRRSQCTA